MAVIRLSAMADADIVSVLAWTEQHFGVDARARYEALLVTALRDVASDPDRAGSAARPELGPSVRSYHLRHSRGRARSIHGYVRAPRHLLLCRAVVPGIVGIGRLLHDAMEVGRHEPADFGDE